MATRLEARRAEMLRQREIARQRFFRLGSRVSRLELILEGLECSRTRLYRRLVAVDGWLETHGELEEPTALEAAQMMKPELRSRLPARLERCYEILLSAGERGMRYAEMAEALGLTVAQAKEQMLKVHNAGWAWRAQWGVYVAFPPQELN